MIRIICRFSLIALVLLVVFPLGAFSCATIDRSRPIPTSTYIDVYESSSTIRVALEDHSAGCNFTVPGAFNVYAFYSNRLLTRGDRVSALTVRAVPQGILFGDKLLPISAVRVAPERGKRCEINGSAYRGEIHFVKDGPVSLVIVNRVPLEEYLYGVVPSEVFDSWPQDALVAQAIAARSWALNRIFIKQEAPFDVYADQRSQVYKGHGAEKPNATKAVDFSRDIVLTYGGRIFPAYFHSYCGGSTTNNAEVFGESLIKPLSGGLCRYCSVGKDKDFIWKKVVSKRDFLDALARGGKTIPDVTAVRPLRSPAQAHCHEFEVVTPIDSFHVKGTDLRGWLGLRSTAVSQVEVRVDGLTFTGTGYGHGVGLCQWGCKGMAQSGARYEEILRQYYPNAVLTRMKGKY